MGRESSHGRKEVFNLPPLVLKARAPNDGSAFCIGFSRLEVPAGWDTSRFGNGYEDKLF